MTDLYEYENQLRLQGYQYIAGTDEAGRGCLAGPVVVAAIILPASFRLDGVNDSKKLTAKKREELYPILLQNALDYDIEFLYPDEIDQINILEASRKGMYECIYHLKKYKPDYVLIDAVKLPKLPMKNEPLIHGDAICFSIAAASILAKVARDHYMDMMAIVYPQYGFEKHKGYGTKAHMAALNEFGITPIHRKSYEPVRQIIVKNENKTLFDL